MLVLVATNLTQKDPKYGRENDFNWCRPGELVTFAFECDSLEYGEDRIDDSCGCHRSLGGCETRKATTTILVLDREITQEQYQFAILTHLKEGGWLKPELTSPEEAIEWVTQDSQELLKIAAFFKEGDILEKRGDDFKLRATVLAESLERVKAAHPAQAGA